MEAAKPCRAGPPRKMVLQRLRPSASPAEPLPQGSGADHIWLFQTPVEDKGLVEIAKIRLKKKSDALQCRVSDSGSPGHHCTAAFQVIIFSNLECLLLRRTKKWLTNL